MCWGWGQGIVWRRADYLVSRKLEYRPIISALKLLAAVPLK